MQQDARSPSPSRRGFLATTIAVLQGGFGLALAVPVVRFVLSPLRRRSEPHWIELGDVREFSERAEPTQVVVTAPTEEGYSTHDKQVRLYVCASTSADEGVAVLSAVCSHKGCNVNWRSAETRFACPCHGGTFDREGAVLGGPPPRPLARVQTRVDEQGRLFVLVGGERG